MRRHLSSKLASCDELAVKLVVDGRYRGRNSAGMYTRCVCLCVCVLGGVRGKPQTFDLAIPVNSFTNRNTACLDGEGRWARAGGPGDYKANLRTDGGHLCPQRTAGIRDPRCANEGRTAGLGSACLEAFRPYWCCDGLNPPLCLGEKS